MKRLAPLVLFLCLSNLCLSSITDDGTTIEFQVVTVDKTPIEGADVELSWPTGKPDGISGNKRTVTDDRGWFRFKVDSAFDVSNGGPRHLILVRKEGLAVGWENSSFRNTDPITLYPLSRFSGEVVDKQGRPVAGAQVRILSLFLETHNYGGIVGSVGKSLVASDLMPFMAVQTDQDGSFIIDHLPEGFQVELLLSKEGYAEYYTYQLSEDISYHQLPALHRVTGKPLPGLPYRKRVGPEYTAGMTDVVFTLKPPGAIQGNVIDRDTDKLLSGISLSLYLNGDGDLASLPAKFRTKVQCTTDANGLFGFRNLEKGTHVLALDESVNNYVSRKMNIEVSEGQNRSDVVFRLSRGGILNLELIDSTSRKGIGNCIVCFQVQGTTFTHSFPTDSEGKLIRHFSPGTYAIEGFEKTDYGQISRRHVFTIKSEQTTSMSLELQKKP